MEKLKVNLPDVFREGSGGASSAKGGKKSFMNNWRQLSETCEAVAIVAISLGVNLLTSQLDGIDFSGTFSLKRALGLTSSLLVTFAGIRLLLCRWWIAAEFESFNGVVHEAEENIDNSPLLKGRIHWNFRFGMLALSVGFVIYVTRGIWE